MFSQLPSIRQFIDSVLVMNLMKEVELQIPFPSLCTRVLSSPVPLIEWVFFRFVDVLGGHLCINCFKQFGFAVKYPSFFLRLSRVQTQIILCVTKKILSIDKMLPGYVYLRYRLMECLPQPVQYKSYQASLNKLIFH